MERAVCIRCGLLKKSTFSSCERCGLDPTESDETMAKSIRLSTRYLSANGELVSVSELELIANQIENGTNFTFDSDEISNLLSEKSLIDQGLAVSDIFRIILFIMTLLVPGLIGLFFLLR